MEKCEIKAPASIYSARERAPARADSNNPGPARLSRNYSLFMIYSFSHIFQLFISLFSFIFPLFVVICW